MDFINKSPEAPLGQEDLTCPFLGMIGDRSTSLAYPSERNLCHKSRSLDAPKLEHQRTHCLPGEYHLCPVSTGKPVTHLPEDLRLQDQMPRQEKWFYWLILILVVGVITVGGVILIFQFNTNNNALPRQGSNTTIPEENIPDKPRRPTPSLTRTVHATSYPATSTIVLATTPPQATKTESGAIHGLDELIGSAYRFVIHRMLPGETLFALATQYHTSADAIKKVNYNMPDPIWVDWPVVIPVDTSDVSGLPTFEAFEELEDDVSIEELADLLNLDVASLLFYNGLEPGYILSSWEWILIPHSMDLN